MSSSVNEPSFRESVEIMYNRAVQLMDLPHGLKEKIRVCNAAYTVRFGVRLRGDIHTFTGYRSVHSEHMEPVKGGIRYSLDDTMRIAYQQMSQRWHSRDDVKDSRTAAFMLAIDKIAAGYRAKGI